MKYQDKVIVLTGASQGIGRALALRLAEQRPKLVLAARDEGALEAVAEECEGRGASALAVPTDVTDVARCRALVEATIDRFRALDVLVNNAGIGLVARFDALQDPVLYESVMRVNYLGSVYPSFFALPHLKRSRGQIVAIASLAGLTGVPTRSGYAASKHAMIGFFDSLRIEVAPEGVDVTIVCPHFVRSEIRRRSSGPDGEPLAGSPVQESRIMTAEACARLTVAAMEKRQRMLVMTLKGKLGRIARLVSPALVDRLARRAVERGR